MWLCRITEGGMSCFAGRAMVRLAGVRRPFLVGNGAQGKPTPCPCIVGEEFGALDSFKCQPPDGVCQLQYAYVFWARAMELPS